MKLTQQQIDEIELALKANKDLEYIKLKYNIDGCNCKLRQLITNFLNQHR